MMDLKIGDYAPEFVGLNQRGEEVRLKDFLGKKLILYFYPKNDTPGCTAQACNLRDNYASLLEKGYIIIGISTDSAKSHQRFTQRYKLPFQLITDKDRTIHAQYGTWVQKSMFGKKYWGTARVTFLINEEGKIAAMITRVNTDNHTVQILNSSHPDI